MHGRIRMTIDPRISNAGMVPVGFTRQTPPAPRAKRREVFGESHDRASCILLRTALEANLHMNDSV